MTASKPALVRPMVVRMPLMRTIHCLIDNSCLSEGEKQHMADHITIQFLEMEEQCQKRSVNLTRECN